MKRGTIRPDVANRMLAANRRRAAQTEAVSGAYKVYQLKKDGQPYAQPHSTHADADAADVEAKRMNGLNPHTTFCWFGPEDAVQAVTTESILGSWSRGGR